jgi:hypothetical protein
MAAHAQQARGTKPPPTQRQKLKEYVEALQNTPDDVELRQKIVELAATLKPPPVIPEEARRYYVKAVTLQKQAKTAAEVTPAIVAYSQALLLAPWWADGYYNMSSALELAGRFPEAMLALKLYLATNPKDARAAQDRIYAIEAEQEHADVEEQARATQEEAERRQREQAQSRREAEAKQQEVERQRAEARRTRWAGYWSQGIPGSRILLKIDGNNFTMTQVVGCWNFGRDGSCVDSRPDNTPLYFGTVGGDGSLSGHRVTPFLNAVPCPVPAGSYPFSRDEISSDGTQLTFVAYLPRDPNCAPLENVLKFVRER